LLLQYNRREGFKSSYEEYFTGMLMVYISCFFAYNNEEKRSMEVLMSRNDNPRREEIIRLQNDIIRQMTERNLRNVGEDLWGRPTDLDNIGEESTPPPGYPEVPDIFSTKKPEEKKAETPKAEEKKAEEKPPENIEDLKKELHSYIGLDAIKDEVQSLINLVTIYNLRRQNDLPTEELSLHMVFSGNPGTGKTMIARLMSRIYHSLGILSKGHLVEVDRSGLVAGYVGQTAIKTQEIIQKALGGVLFIDEAYALTTRGPQDYGQEAVETLLKAMEDHRDDLVVIVAGYVDLMNDFVQSNPGLQSRFNRFMYFADYTIDEMMGIFDLRANKAGYHLSEDARDTLKEILMEESENAIGFGNARGVRNLFEQAISRQANRLAKEEEITRDELMLLTREDLMDAEDDEAELEEMTEKIEKEEEQDD
jgi:SpoVK/Ycf46/Vps4 family AAA+-type ATPase